MKDSTESSGGKRRLAYIMGPNYSGSTLLTLLLADHPQIATVGELKATSMGDISTYHCSCGELFLDCPFWDQVQHKMVAEGCAFTFYDFKTHFRAPNKPLNDRLLRASLRGPLFEAIRETGFMLSPAAQKIRLEIIKQNQIIIESICALQQAPTFLDDSKEPVRLKHLLASQIWDIRTIHLIRDGRGVANSYMRHNKTTMPRAARQWLHTQRECDRMAKRLGKNRCIPVYYEDLCREPAKTLADIYLFLGLTVHPGSSGPHRTKHIMGNQMRLGSLEDIRLDEKWKHTLSAEDLHIFTQTAGELNQLHGYS